jgi:hypothetical protein
MSMEMPDRVRAIADAADCRVRPRQGLPAIGGGLDIPADLMEFYELCGGVDLYESSEFPISIAPPTEFQPSNIVIIGEQYPDDISSSWYIVAETPDSEHLSIDLSPERQGRCYDSFHDVHGIVGSSPIIASNFSELLGRLLENAGRHWYWLQPGFVSLGDAYGG